MVYNGDLDIDSMEIILDGVPASIKQYKIKDNEQASDIYNLNGLQVNNQYKGFVIINGKKYYNK